jgi:hypothetical protein
MIGNIRKILSLPTKVVEFIDRKVRPSVLISNRALSDSLLTDSYLITGVRVRFIHDQAVDRFNMDSSSIAEYSLVDERLTKLIPSLLRKMTICSNEQIDIDLGTATILQQSNVSKLKDHLSRSHTDRYKLVPLTPEDRYFQAWYALELRGTNLLTNQEATIVISNVYWSYNLSSNEIIQRVHELRLEEVLARYASGLDQIV